MVIYYYKLNGGNYIMNVTDNREISIEGVINFAEKDTNTPLELIQVTDSLTRVVVPKACEHTLIRETYNNETGYCYMNAKNEDITEDVVITIFASDVNENGNFLVTGINHGVLVIDGRDSFTDAEIDEMYHLQ